MAAFEQYASNVREMSGYTLVRRDPFGLWYVTKGGKDAGVPKELKGHAFTNTSSAAAALQNYLDRSK